MRRTVAQAVLIADGEFVFSGLIGKICDGLAVGRPRRIAIGDGGTARDVANVALVGGNGENLSPGFEHSAGTGRRDAEILNALGLDLGEVRPHGVDVADDADRYTFFA